MKKLLLALVVCITGVALSAMPPKYTGPHYEIDLPTVKILAQKVNWASLGISSPPTQANAWTMGGALGNWFNQIPDASMTVTPNTGGLFATGTEGTRGVGVTMSVTGGAISFDLNLNWGVGWAYDIVQVDGKDVIRLKWALTTPSGSDSGSIIVTPELLGLDSEDVAFNAVTGRYPQSTVDKLVNGSQVSSANSPWVESYTAWRITITTSIWW